MSQGVAAREPLDRLQGNRCQDTVDRKQRIVPISPYIQSNETSADNDLFLDYDEIEAVGVSRNQACLIRLLDFCGACLGIILFFPFLLLVPLVIKLDSSGAAVYKQKRVGKMGKVFTLFKFRTMVAHAESHWGFLPASENDERITRVGKVLRKTRLDELPQLFNVIKGDMSLVGPRPENLYRVNLHQALRGPRLGVKPGITGLAQIRSSYDIKPDHKIKYDYLYIQKRSFWLNLYILMMTIPVVIKKTGW